jgi:eukaryotic-like serine/threonine-protein kinase
MSTAGAWKKHKALDRFEVLGELGQGAASRILHIRDCDSYQHFAMKVVIRRTADEQKFLDQAKHEFEVARRLDYPSILKIYDIRVIRKWFREREVRTLLEYVNGETLEQIGSPAIPLLVLVFAEVAAAVNYMHRAGVFHADLKPNNIMVSRSGQVKVIDFGLAWLRGERKGRVQGTVGYLAPEQMRDRVVTESTDIFNLGATIYRMLTGRTATGGGAGGNAIMTTKAIITPAHELQPLVPLGLSELVSRCCENKPQKRPGSMNEVAAALEKMRDEMRINSDDIPGLLRQRHSNERQ